MCSGGTSAFLSIGWNRCTSYVRPKKSALVRLALIAHDKQSVQVILLLQGEEGQGSQRGSMMNKQAGSCAKSQLRLAYLKGASPVPGPTMMMGVPWSAGSRKSGLRCTYTGSISPTCQNQNPKSKIRLSGKLLDTARMGRTLGRLAVSCDKRLHKNALSHSWPLQVAGQMAQRHCTSINIPKK